MATTLNVSFYYDKYLCINLKNLNLEHGKYWLIKICFDLIVDTHHWLVIY